MSQYIIVLSLFEIQKTIELLKDGQYQGHNHKAINVFTFVIEVSFWYQNLMLSAIFLLYLVLTSLTVCMCQELTPYIYQSINLNL
jgi:hypothetical protein